MNKEIQKNTYPGDKDDVRCNANGKNCINSHFTLAVVAVVLSCFMGFWTMPMALASLILSLRAQDLAHDNRPEEARRTAYWTAVFGWITLAVALLPVILVIFFGGAIAAFFAALLAAV